MRKIFTQVIMAFTLSLIVNLSTAQCIKTSCNGSSNTGTYSSAIGNQTTSSGNYAFSSGNQSSASNESSTALGHMSTASGKYSFAVGYKSVATEQTSIAIGYEAKSSFFKSFAIGELSTTNATQSYAIGQNCITNASQSLAIGRYMQTNASGAIALGSSTSMIGPLINDKNNSLMIGFNSTVPTLFVGPSPNAQSSGNVGIGISDPTQKLDIDGNIRLRNNAIIGTWSSNSLTFNTNSAAQMTIAATGQIGVGTTTPTQKLDIDGNIRLRNDGIIGTWSSNSLTFNTNSTARMTIAPTGLIGVGTSIPTEKLDVDGNIRLRNNSAIGTWSSNSLTFNTNSTARMTIAANGNVGIGVATPEYKLHIAGDAKFDSQVFINSGGLYVNGEVKAKKYLATISPFPDYVFEPGYKLLTLAEVENFINENGHLPEIPNAANVEKNGVELGEMNALLLKKIEELTLYLIEQDKKIAELQNVIKNSSK